jgi:hypothetical protein
MVWIRRFPEGRGRQGSNLTIHSGPLTYRRNRGACFVFSFLIISFVDVIARPPSSNAALIILLVAVVAAVAFLRLLFGWP